MCNVPSIAVVCSKYIEWFSGTAPRFFLKLLVTIPVAPIITGRIVHFRFHIRWISIHKLLYFTFFSASFCTTFLSAGIATYISVHAFPLLFLIIISGLFAVNSLFVCTAWFLNTVTSPSSNTFLGMCVYHLSVISVPKALHIEQCKCVQTLSCLIKYSFFAKMGHPEVRWSVVSSYYYYYFRILCWFKVNRRQCCAASPDLSSVNCSRDEKGSGSGYNVQQELLWSGLCRPLIYLSPQLLNCPSAETLASHLVHSVLRMYLCYVTAKGYKKLRWCAVCRPWPMSILFFLDVSAGMSVVWLKSILTQRQESAT